MTDTRRIVLSDTERDILRGLGIGKHPGYVGVFTRANAIGAAPAGTRVRHPIGSFGTILGSINVPRGIVYFVEWDVTPGQACMTHYDGAWQWASRVQN